MNRDTVMKMFSSPVVVIVLKTIYETIRSVVYIVCIIYIRIG